LDPILIALQTYRSISNLQNHEKLKEQNRAAY
jgi:hypothetical protein